MDELELTEQSGENTPYIKPRKKKNASKILFLLAIVIIAVALVITLTRSPSGRLKAFFDGIFGTEATETTTTQTTAPINTERGLYDYDISAVPEGALGVIPCDLSALKLEKKYKNATEYEIPDSSKKPEFKKDGKIRILVICSHPYESYTDNNITSAPSYSELCGEITVAHIAKYLCEKLSSAGIGAEYADTKVTRALGAYSASYNVISDFASAHPELEYVIDIHRGMITDDSGNVLRPVTETEDKVSAQIRLIEGTGYDGWEAHTEKTFGFFDMINEKYPTLLMPTEITESRKNQHIPPTVLTLEIGTAANTGEEAINAAEKLAEAIINNA